jgi:hypothetical protein
LASVEKNEDAMADLDAIQTQFNLLLHDYNNQLQASMSLKEINGMITEQRNYYRNELEKKI